MVLMAMAVAVFWYRSPPTVPVVLSLLLFLVTALWLYKALYELGLDNVRGQFYLTMAVAFLFQGIGFALTRVDNTVTLGLAGMLTYVFARFFFFLANVRYIVHFQSLGYRLNAKRAAIVLLLTILFSAIATLIPNVVPMLFAFSPYSIFILLDVGMVFIVIYNLFLLWGSEIAKKWAIGSVVIVSFLLGDAFFIGGAPSSVSIFFWTLASTLMGIIATIRG